MNADEKERLVQLALLVGKKHGSLPGFEVAKFIAAEIRAQPIQENSHVAVDINSPVARMPKSLTQGENMTVVKKLEDFRILWLDMETTGLNPLTDHVLEVGVIMTDGKFSEISRRSWVLHASAEVLGRMPQEVVKMHASSGLWNEVLTSRIENSEEVNNSLFQFIVQHQGKGAYLAGNSVGDFDRHFLRRDFPKCNDYISHRSINASTFKALFSMYAPEVASPQVDRAKAHRALADCEHAIAELKFWLEKTGCPIFNQGA